MTVTVGIDLAAEPAGTAAVRIEWHGAATVTDVVRPADDDTILALVEGAAKIGIDCPLGWPDAFVDFVAQHRVGDVQAAAATIAQRRPLAYRATDLHVIAEPYRLRPLSVSADRIAHAAFRAAGLLARLGEPDRSGAGRVVEAYPAGSLKQWGLQHRQYKKSPSALAGLLAELEHRAQLTFSRRTRAACLGSADAFDALVVALTARAAHIGRTEPVPVRFRERARREGWISLPHPALEALPLSAVDTDDTRSGS